MQQNKYDTDQILSDFTSVSHYINNQFYLFLNSIDELYPFPLNALQFYQCLEEKVLELFATYAEQLPALYLFEFNKLNLLHCLMIALLVKSYHQNLPDVKTPILQQASRLYSLKERWIMQAELKKEKIRNRRLRKRITTQEEIIQKLQTDIKLQTISISAKIKHETQTIRGTIHSKQQLLNDSEIQKSRQLGIIHKLERQITMLSDKIDVLGRQNQDLKNIISSLSAANTPPEQIRLDTMQGRKIIVVGGHPRWISKLRLTCPDFVYIGTDQLNFDYSILKNAEQIAICYLYMNHALYRKTIEYARKKHIPVGYVKCISDVFYFFK